MCNNSKGMANHGNGVGSVYFILVLFILLAIIIGGAF